MLEFVSKPARRRIVLAFALLCAFIATGLAQGMAYRIPGLLGDLCVAHYRVSFFLSFPLWKYFAGWPMSLRILISATGAAGAWVLASTVAFALLAPAPKRERPTPTDDAASGVDPIRAPVTGPRFSRRTFLTMGAYSAPAIVAGTTVYSASYAPENLEVRRYTIPVRGLPKSLDGIRIAHVSDLHLGPYVSQDQIRRALRLATDEATDIALLTGDYVSTRGVFPIVARLIRSELRARHGVLATMGNHDHWERAQDCRRAFSSAKIPLIDNNRRFLTANGLSDTPSDDALCIAGVGDFWEDIQDFESAFRDVPAEMPRLVLSHNPDVAEMFTKSGKTPPRVDLMLSGHTHGGQVHIPGAGALVVPSKYGQRYAGGLVEGPHWRVLISRGVGMTVLPVRFLVPPEISIVTLVGETP